MAEQSSAEKQAKRQALAAEVVLGTEGSRSAEEHHQIRSARVALAMRNDAEGALQIAQGRPMEVGSNLRKKGESIGLVRAVNTAGETVRTPDAQDRYDRYKNALAAAEAFVDLQRGYEQVPQGRKDEIIEQTRLLLLSDRGGLGRHIAQLTEAEGKKKIDELLKDKDYARYVRDELVALQGQQFTITSTETYYANMSNQRVLQQTYGDREAILNQVFQSAQHALDDLQNIRNGNPLSPGQIGSREDSDKAIAILVEGVDKLIDVRDAIQNKVVGGQVLNPEDRILLQHVIAEQNKYAQQIVRVHMDNQGRLPTAEAEEERFQKRANEYILARQQEIRNRVQGQRVDEDRQTILEDRGIEEEELTRSMESVFVRAAYKKLLTDLNTSVELLKAQEPETEAEFIKAVTDGIADHLENTRWRKKVLKRRKGLFGFFRKKQEDLAIDTAKVRQESDLLFKRGPEVLLRRVLRGVRIRESGGFPRALTVEQIDEMMENEHFVETWKEEVAGQVMGRKQMFDGYRPTEIHHFLNTKWGRETMEKAYNKDEEYRAFLSFFAEKGVVNFDSPTFKDKFAQWAAQHPGSLFFPKTSFRWAADGGHINQVVDRSRPELVTRARYTPAA